MNQQEHWEKIYQTKTMEEVSWYQPEPAVSIEFIRQLRIPLTASIIDVGGGDSLFADYLLQMGYTNITVLDISSTALEKAKKRLGQNAAKVKWIVSDVNAFRSSEKYDVWHDRAAFHFLITEDAIAQYLSVAANSLKQGGKMIIGTFSETGPAKCSGLPVKQYSETSLTTILSNWFQKIKCITTDHITPFNTVQQFLFCSFQKLILP